MIKRLLSRQRIRLPHNLSRLLIDQLKSTIQLLPGGSPSSLTIPSRLVKLCMIAQERRSLPNWMDTTRHGSSMNDARSKGPSGGLRLCRPPQPPANVRTSIHGPSHSLHHILPDPLGDGFHLYVAPLGGGTTAESSGEYRRSADYRIRTRVPASPSALASCDKFQARLRGGAASVNGLTRYHAPHAAPRVLHITSATRNEMHVSVANSLSRSFTAVYPNVEAAY